MTSTPIPAGALTVDDEPSNDNGDLWAVRLHNGSFWCWVTFTQRARLLSPPRPTGVPDDAVPATLWFGPADNTDGARVYGPNGWEDVEAWRFRLIGVPVPPYQPDPDPEAISDEKNEPNEASVAVCPACDGSPEWPSLRSEGGSLSCRFCNRTLTWNVMRDQGPFRCYCPAAREAACPKCHGAGWVTPEPEAIPDTADSPTEPTCGICGWVGGHHGAHGDLYHARPAAPPVAAGERTGPLGLSEQDTRKIAKTDDAWSDAVVGEHPNLARVGWDAVRWACRAAVAEWDAAPQPTETLADIADDIRNRNGYLGVADCMELADRIEAASRPDPDTITVNRDDLRMVIRHMGTLPAPRDRTPYHAWCRLDDALAAAGLPQEPTEPEAQR